MLAQYTVILHIFYIILDHLAIPRVEEISTKATSIHFTLLPTDQYELNGRLENVVFYYQPIPVYTQTTGDHFSFDILNQVRSQMNETNYEKRYLPLNHEMFFSSRSDSQGLTSHDMKVDGLHTYTFYGFFMTYQTNHSEGLRRTNVSIVRTKEGGMEIIWLH